jgi:hypothetical protein
MTTFSPDEGWHTLLGAGWQYAWWGKDGFHRGGLDFQLETQCRENRTEFQKVLRASWLATARGDPPINEGWSPEAAAGKDGMPHGTTGYGEGGLWSALALCMKKVAVNGTAPSLFNRSMPTPLVKTKVAALNAKWAAPPTSPPVPTDAPDGSIIIPAAAYTNKKPSASLTVMRSGCVAADHCETGEQLLSGVHTGLNKVCPMDPGLCSFAYEFTAAADKTFYLTANFSTWQVNQDLHVSINAGAPQAVPVFYTVGWWNETQPLEVKLVKGKNTLNFTRSSERTIAFKTFTFHATKPDIPAPFPPYVPAPAPPPNAYKQVAPTTTCEKQGITVVPKSECSQACAAVGLNFAGAKPVQSNMPGCFAIVSGKRKGQCEYNTNTSAHCESPPCPDKEASCIAPGNPQGCEVAAICLTK